MPRSLPKNTSEISIPAYGDGYLLKALLTTCDGIENDGSFIILGTATAVPAWFYIPFLAYLAKNGIPSITFDWRGCHSNLKEHLSQCTATLTDWGTKDLAGVIDYVDSNYPNRRIVHIGHSVGGHVMPLPYNAHKISHAVTVGTQNAFYPLTSFRSRHQIFWNVAVPAASSIFGYFPGSKLRIVGDLPTSVMQEWRAWANQPYYVAKYSESAAKSYEEFKAPILAISVDDDEYATRLGVQLLHQSLINAPIQFWHIEHNDIPGKFPLRHVGFFLPYAKPLWNQILPFLKSGVLPPIDTLTPHAPTDSDLLCRL